MDPRLDLYIEIMLPTNFGFDSVVLEESVVVSANMYIAHELALEGEEDNSQDCQMVASLDELIISIPRSAAASSNQLAIHITCMGKHS